MTNPEESTPKLDTIRSPERVRGIGGYAASVGTHPIEELEARRITIYPRSHVVDSDEDAWNMPLDSSGAKRTRV